MSSNKRVINCIAVGVLASLLPSIASATTVALSENNSANGLNLSPADLDAAFTGLGAGDMVFSATDDAQISEPSGSAFALNQNINGATLGGNGTSRVLVKFDLSSIPSGATINKAQLQFWGTSGNNSIANSLFGAITTSDWSEGAVTANSPAGTPNTPEWGPGANAVFALGAGNDVPSTTPIDTRNGWFIYPNPGSGTGVIPGKSTGQNVFSYYMIEDVTASLQSMIGGSNFGWGYDNLNYKVSSSESTITNSFAGPSFGAETRPILFVDYTASVVPEPSAFLLFAIGLGLIAGKTRTIRS